MLRLVLALGVAVPTLWVLWESTFPGGPVMSLAVLSLPLLPVGLLWLVGLVRLAAGRSSSRRAGSRAWLVIAPVAAATVLALASSDLLLRARFGFDRGAFEEVVATLPPGTGTDDFVAVSLRERGVGSYTITGIYRIRAGIVLYERHGCFLNDAGFAYLPRGPEGIQGNGAWESPQFRHLGGAWYAWTASW